MLYMDELIKQETNIKELPPELLHHIFDYCKPTEKISWMCVLSNDDDMFNYVFKKNFNTRKYRHQIVYYETKTYYQLR